MPCFLPQEKAEAEKKRGFLEFCGSREGEQNVLCWGGPWESWREGRAAGSREELSVGSLMAGAPGAAPGSKREGKQQPDSTEPDAFHIRTLNSSSPAF